MSGKLVRVHKTETDREAVRGHLDSDTLGEYAKQGIGGAAMGAALGFNPITVGVGAATGLATQGISDIAYALYSANKKIAWQATDLENTLFKLSRLVSKTVPPELLPPETAAALAQYGKAYKEYIDYYIRDKKTAPLESNLLTQQINADASSIANQPQSATPQTSNESANQIPAPIAASKKKKLTRIAQTNRVVNPPLNPEITQAWLKNNQLVQNLRIMGVDFAKPETDIVRKILSNPQFSKLGIAPEELANAIGSVKGPQSIGKIKDAIANSIPGFDAEAIQRLGFVIHSPEEVAMMLRAKTYNAMEEAAGLIGKEQPQIILNKLKNVGINLNWEQLREIQINPRNALRYIQDITPQSVIDNSNIGTTAVELGENAAKEGLLSGAKGVAKNLFNPTSLLKGAKGLGIGTAADMATKWGYDWVANKMAGGNVGMISALTKKGKDILLEMDKISNNLNNQQLRGKIVQGGNYIWTLLSVVEEAMAKMNANKTQGMSAAR